MRQDLGYMDIINWDYSDLTKRFSRIHLPGTPLNPKTSIYKSKNTASVYIIPN